MKVDELVEWGWLIVGALYASTALLALADGRFNDAASWATVALLALIIRSSRREIRRLRGQSVR